MLSDDLYDACLPILQDKALDEDEKTEKIEDVVRSSTSLTGKELERTVLDTLWRFRNASSATSTYAASPPPSRHTVIRRPSPAIWQATTRTPTPQSSPGTLAPPGLHASSPAVLRTRSSNASPFTSPRASPRLALSAPYIPHSPSLETYQFSDPSPTQEAYGDMGSDAVEWLVSDDGGSNASSSYPGDNSLNGGAAEWLQPQAMDPYDMLRSILPDALSNEEIEKALEVNGYDLSATILALMESAGLDAQQNSVPAIDSERTVLVGKSMSPSARPATPVGQQKSAVLCKYWLASGHCARADCRFSHDSRGTLCKYWLSGNCLAGDSCAFSHDPTATVAQMMIQGTATPPLQHAQPNLQDYAAFPNLMGTTMPHLPAYLAPGYDPSGVETFYPSGTVIMPPPGLNPMANYTPNSSSHPQSRPTSRHASRAPTPSVPAVDDNEAFPSLGSVVSAKGAKKHHGKRGGHGHAHKESPSSLAELVRMSPSPSPAQTRRGVQKTRGAAGGRESNATALAIPAPEHIPWLATGESANKAYLKARAEAFKHGGLRNKFLQSAAQAYNRHDSRAAKALSLRGQSENNLMREAHREAASILYEERNKDVSSKPRELYVDLHGLHAEEAVDYLSKALRQHENMDPSMQVRPVYAITGTGHHSKNGKDKIGKSIRAFLTEWRYAFREFSVPGDRGNMGGIIGIDPTSWDRSLEREKTKNNGFAEGRKPPTGPGQSTKVVILRKEDVLLSADPEEDSG